jgi:demethoxyubiquinone hydroxylase (CLK1/Coq7/Cat5 family)
MRVESNVTGTADDKQVVDTLNKFLRGELSAVETYQQAIEKLRDSAFVRELSELCRAHEDRVQFLRQEISRLGGRPADSSGPWGGFAKLIEGGAKLFGEKAAISALEEGEDHGLKLYRGDLDKLDPTTGQLVENRLLADQERSHRIMSALKHSLH